MVDLHKAFGDFHARIVVSTGNTFVLKLAREAVRERIRRYFHNVLKLGLPAFLGEGAYAMDTMVQPLDGEYGIDDGVYLEHLEDTLYRHWPNASTVLHWMLAALENGSSAGFIENQPRIRIRQNGLYRVDLSVYGKTYGKYLVAAQNARGWRRGYPSLLKQWFNCHIHMHGEQLRRIVRLVKAWADYQSLRHGPMPGGLILTVLVTRHFQCHQHDHVSLIRTLHAVSNAVHPVFYLPNPVDIQQELTAWLTPLQKWAFQKAVDNSARDAIDALGLEGSQASWNIWRNIFGNRFPTPGE